MFTGYGAFTTISIDVDKRQNTLVSGSEILPFRLAGLVAVPYKYTFFAVWRTP